MSTPWTEAEKASIRAYLGFPNLFHQQEPRLENAINSVQTVSDGGALDNDATQARMRVALAQLDAVDAKLSALQCSYQVLEAGTDKVRLDSIRAAWQLRQDGKRIISQLAIPLGTRPVRDYFSSSETSEYISDSSWFFQDL